jgi:hypothetical protein
MTFVCHPDLSRLAFHLQIDFGQPAAFCTASNPVTSGKPLIRENPAAARSSTCGQDWPYQWRLWCGVNFVEVTCSFRFRQKLSSHSSRVASTCKYALRPWVRRSVFFDGHLRRLAGA